MTIAKGETVKRGDYVVTYVRDLTRVAHPKTAEIISIDDDFFVIPELESLPIRRFSGWGDAMGYVERFVGEGQ
jgi:hypothetical protein